MFNWNQLPRPIIALSPMADMTDSAFCRVVKSMASPIIFREMASAEAIVRGNKKTLSMTEVNPGERPLVQQIFGNDPATMAEAALIIETKHQPDAFDINMGCPVYKIISNFNGAALMKDPKLAAEIIKKVKSVITVPLSIKIRTGWSDPTDCFEFSKIIEAAGADLITIHGRTKDQGYSGQADWKIIAKAKEQVKIPVLANGDIFDAPLTIEALKITNCDGVMIARGALGNPWIFSQIETLLSGKTFETISLEERVRVIKLHAKLHVEQHGPHGIVTFRKHLSWYFKGFPDTKKLRSKLMLISSLENLDSILSEFITK